ncbi:MAG TPA: signal peptidase I [Pyrinomonadaceae bacterium]|nr:signal peptidase I [Pyrinomonadaceae bacterium]
MSREQRGAVEEPPSVSSGERAGAAKAKGGGASRPEAPQRGVFREYFESLVVTAVMALFGMTFIVQAVKVPTGSMQNTILIGDHLLVNKFIFAPGPPLPFLPMRDIRRGDVIVFKYPGKFQAEPRFRDNVQVDDTRPDNTPYKTNYVKRVVGLPGDRVEIRGTDVFLNGQPHPEHKVAAESPPGADDGDPSNGVASSAPLTDERGLPLVGENAPQKGEAPYVVYWSPDLLASAGDVMTRLERLSGTEQEEVFDVPEGHYFVMGDNRENSLDSRFWGYVPREAVIGKAMFVYWSFDESLPSNGNFLEDFIKNTRWGRTGTLVR